MGIEDALVTVNCPFCGVEIVSAYDHSELPDDLSDEEREEITIETWDETDGCCEHLAFRSDWAYAGSEYIQQWEEEMEKLSVAVSEDQEENDPDVLANAIHVDGLDLEPYAEKVLSGYEFAVSCQYVEKFDGVKCGGPTYMHIFLKKKA